MTGPGPDRLHKSEVKHSQVHASLHFFVSPAHRQRPGPGLHCDFQHLVLQLCSSSGCLGYWTWNKHLVFIHTNKEQRSNYVRTLEAEEMMFFFVFFLQTVSLDKISLFPAWTFSASIFFFSWFVSLFSPLQGQQGSWLTLHWCRGSLQHSSPSLLLFHLLLIHALAPLPLFGGHLQGSLLPVGQLRLASSQTGALTGAEAVSPCQTEEELIFL